VRLTFAYATGNGTATAGSDYQAASGIRWVLRSATPRSGRQLRAMGPFLKVLVK
jgi:hypothetical protein